MNTNIKPFPAPEMPVLRPGSRPALVRLADLAARCATAQRRSYSMSAAVPGRVQWSRRRFRSQSCDLCRKRKCLPSAVYVCGLGPDGSPRGYGVDL